MIKVKQSVRNKISKSIKLAYAEGRLTPKWSGKKLSDDTKAKMSATHKGRKHGKMPEHIRLKISKTMSGRNAATDPTNFILPLVRSQTTIYCFYKCRQSRLVLLYYV